MSYEVKDRLNLDLIKKEGTLLGLPIVYSDEMIAKKEKEDLIKFGSFQEAYTKQKTMSLNREEQIIKQMIEKNGYKFDDVMSGKHEINKFSYVERTGFEYYSIDGVIIGMMSTEPKIVTEEKEGSMKVSYNKKYAILTDRRKV